MKQKQDTIKQETYVTKDELESKGYLTSHQSLENVVTKAELEQKGYLTNHQDISNLVTNDKLESKRYLTEHQSISHLVSKDELASKGYLTSHQSLAEYARKSELPQPYNDTEIRGQIASKASNQTVDSLTSRVRALEIKPDNDTIYNDTEVKRDIANLKNNTVTKSELASKGYLTSHQSLANHALKSELNNIPVYRLARGDIGGSGNGGTATINTSYIINSRGIKVGDIVQDIFLNNGGTEEGYWEVTAVNGSTVSLKGIGMRYLTSYSDIHRRLSSLESRPTFDTLTPSQRNSLKGEKGDRGLPGEKGRDGVAGENIINQQNRQALKYWYGSKAQYNAIRYKDASTIYDVYE